MSDIFTIDNLLHSIVAVAFVGLSWPVAHFADMAWVPPIFALLAAVGLYLREASQVGWDFTLRGSWHKHAEWIVGSVAGLVASGVVAGVA